MTTAPRRLVAITVLLSALAAFGGTAVANHVFSDVPTRSVFHDEIAEFGAAGCADGYPDGTFHPEDPVKRQQLARFFARCAGRVVSRATFGYDPVIASDGNRSILTVTVTAPASGNVLIQADTTGKAGACYNPCNLETRLQTTGGANAFTTDGVVDTATILTQAATSNVWSFAIDQGETRTFTLVGRVISDTPNDSLDVSAEMTALFVPFSFELE